jgi:hypothetical protein
MPHKFYSVKLKSGKTKRRVHDSVTGRIIKWVDAEDLDEPEGEFRIVEWVMHWEYTDGSPSGLRNFEIRIRVAEGRGDSDMESLGEDIMESWVSEELITESNFSFDRKGVDFIRYDEYEDIEYKIIDNARPQYQYPKKARWGKWRE